MKGFLEINENFKIGDYVSNNFPEEIQEVINTADMICENNFIFNHKWDMEVCKTPYKFQDKIIWNHIPFQDPEWTFMLNRHKFWLDLGKAYSVTKNEKYALAFFNQINSWIDTVELENPLFKDCTRTIEMGLRAINWSKALEFFKASPNYNEKIRKKIGDSLYQQCQILMDIYDDFRTLSNWGVLQNAGLVVFSIIFEEYKNTKEILETALNRLEYQCQIQILPDGIHWEQSPMYQNEVLNCLLDVAILLKNNGILIPDKILEGIKKLAYSNLIMAKPNHHQPMQGDSDDTDLRDIITRAAYILKDETLKFGSYKTIDFESIWELGINSLEEYETLSSKSPAFTSIQLKESGNFYLRDNFSENGNYLWFRCGPIGSGHGHGEHLHFDLTVYGENLLSDPGRCTYVENDSRRDYLRSVFAHNTTIVDNLPFSEFNGAWGITDSAFTLNSNFITTEKFDFVEAGHLGYLKLHNPVITFRKILYLKPNIWIITDEFHSTGTHTYKQIFNLNPNINIISNNNTINISGKKSKLEMKWLENINLSTENGLFSTEYNKIEENKKIISEITSTGNKMILTVLTGNEINNSSLVNIKEIKITRGDGSEVPSSEARAIEITISDSIKYIFVNGMKDIANQKKSYLVNGILFYGKIALIEIENNKTKINILKY
ncbi:MAG: alginate lyase family protein [Cetobacterium sp.]